MYSDKTTETAHILFVLQVWSLVTSKVFILSTTLMTFRRILNRTIGRLSFLPALAYTTYLTEIGQRP